MFTSCRENTALIWICDNAPGQEIVSYARSWRRGKTFGAERFERELAEQHPAARRSQAQQRFLDFMDSLCAPDVAKGYCVAWPIATVCCHANSMNCWN
jgi:hypothetical protein